MSPPYHVVIIVNQTVFRFENENMCPKLCRSTYEERRLTSEEKAMKSKRVKHCKRRQRDDMPSIPFKDDHGVIVTENRRKIPDRRSYNIDTE